MISVDQANELSRLASLWATSRVRKAVTQYGCGGLRETPESTAERERKANSEFHEYLRSLIGEKS